MEILSKLLIILSPYTAYVTPVYMGIATTIKNRRLQNFKSSNALVVLSIWVAIVGLLNRNLISAGSALTVFVLSLMNSYIIENYKTEEKVEALLDSFIKLSLIPVLIGFVEKLASFFIDMSFMSKLFWSASYIPSNAAYRIYSTFGNPNIAGNWFAAMLIISLYFIAKNERLHKLQYSGMAVLYLAAIVMTGSRGALIGLGAGIVILFLIKRDRGSLIILGLIGISALLVLVFSPEANRPIVGRTDIWTTCFEMIKQSPIFGWGSLGILGKSYEIHGHNIWISITAMFGFVGLFIYLAYRHQVYKSACILIKNKVPTAGVLLSVQGMILGHGIVDFPLFVPQGAVLFFGTSALIISLSRQFSKDSGL